MPEAANLMMLALLTLVLWTLGLAFFMVYRRFTSVRSGTMPGAYYRLYQGGEEPAELRKLTRHYINLHESPVLFYALVLAIFVAGRADAAFAALAWAYVALRILHGLIHTGRNKLFPRFLVFGGGLLVLSAIAIRFAVSLL